MINVGEIIKNARQKKRISQRQLAKMLGISNTAVLHWEKNVNSPSLEMLQKLSEILEIGEDILHEKRNYAPSETQIFADKVFELLTRKIDRYLECKMAGK